MIPELPGLEVLDEIGQGARNVVYRGRLRGRLVAVKFPRRRRDLDKVYQDYLCEASLQGRIRHPGLLEVYEVGRHQDLPFLIQELAEPLPLSERLKRGPCSADETLQLGRQLAATLACVHERGLVHRDVKPANILIGSSGQARLIDFGLTIRPHTSQVGTASGTFSYSAPEQTGMLNRPLDGRADLYALGVVLYECLAGAPPFRSEDPGELMHLHATRQPPALSPQVPSRLLEAVQRLLAKDPDDRFASARQLYDFLGGEPALPPPVRLTLVGRQLQSEALNEHWQRCRQSGRLVLVSGAPGVGKSALISNFLRGQPKTLVVRAACHPQDAPYAVLKRLLTSIAEPAGRIPEWSEGLRRAAGAHGDLLSDFSPALAQLLGRAGGHRQEDPVHHLLALAQFLVQAAGWQPLVVVMEDLHWADPSSLKVLRTVAESWSQTHSLLLLSSSEPLKLELEHLVSLENLNEPALQQLIEEALGDCSDPRLFEQIQLASAGNPLAVLTMLEAALDAGRLVPHWGRWRLVGSGLDLPGDAVETLLARLRGLEQVQLQLLQRAAVFGLQFHVSDLEDEGSATHALLAEARRIRLIERLAGDHYRFLHPRLREALLENLSDQQLRELHAAAAAALGPGQPFRQAQHLWQSFPWPNPLICAQAQRQAGLLACQQHAYEEAYEFLARLGGDHNAESAEAFGYACYQTGRFQEALAHLEGALRLSSPGPQRARIHQRLALVHMVEMDTLRAWPSVCAGLQELGIRLGSAPAMLADLMRLSFSRLGPGRSSGSQVAVRLFEIGAQICFIGGQVPQLVEVVVRGLRLARRQGPSPSLAAFYSSAGILMGAVGLKGLAEHFCRQAQNMAEELQDAAAIARCQILSSVAMRFRGQDSLAARNTWRCLLERGAWLPTLDYLFGVVDLTHNYHFRGLLGKAYETAQLGEQRVRQDHYPFVLTSTLSPVYSAVGRHAEARHYKEICKRYFDNDSTPLSRSAYLVSSLHAEMERGELGPEVESLIEQHRRLGLNPDRGPLPLRTFRILEAYVRYRQASTDRSRLAQFRAALARLGRHRSHSLFDTHYRLLEAGYARLCGQAARARQLLAQAENHAHSTENYWVMIEVAKQRAYLLRDQELFEAAHLQARAAAAMAAELGWLSKLHRIEAEFGLNLRSQSASARDSDTQNALTLRLQRHLKALLEVTQATAQVLDVSRISDLVLVEVMRILTAERAFLFLIEGEELRFQCGRDAQGQILSLPPNYASSVVEQVRIRARATLLSADEDGQVTASASIQTHDLRSILAAPLLWRDALVGVVYLDNRLSRGAFSGDDVEVLQALANQVAVSLETARSARLELQVRGERDQRMLAEQLSEMVGSLLTHLDTPEILTRVLEGLERIVGYAQAQTRLLEEGDLDAEVLQSNRPVLRNHDLWLGTCLPSPSGPLGQLILQREKAFSRAEVELVHTLASYAGIALENSQLFASVQRMATVDELTGILNRRQFLKEAQDELQRADRLGHALSLVMFDVDHFKKFNDTHGHAIGDVVLRTVAGRCRDCLRGIDHLGRLGGEEFAVLLVGTALEPGCATADRLRLAICQQPFASSNGDLQVSISLGVAQRQPGEGLDALLERADQALYAAKRGGRNQVAG
ncbi:MAG: diguanylate cyclase [Vulcanimicrobiota bacterium]